MADPDTSPSTFQERAGTDHAVRALSSVTPKLRRDVRITFQDRRGQPIYVLEDLVYRRYFQIGLPEYQFLLRLDGRRTGKEVFSEHVRQAGADALSESDATTLLRWLIDHDLLEAENASQEDRRFQHSIRREDKKPKKGLSKVFFFRLPLGNPDRFLAALKPWLSWFFSPAFFLVWLAVGIAALYTLGQSWSLFTGAARNVILPSNWLSLILTMGGLKIIHEIAHGIAVKRYGAPVPEWGVQILAFITPLTFVDASASWRFQRRWRRIVVAAAGMYVELFVAAIAVIIWSQTSGGLLNTMAYNTIFAASTVTVLFNANPLMRFDGYYILTDLLSLPNLAQRGQQFVSWVARRFIIGLKDLPMPPGVRERPVIIAAYGIGATLWKVLIWVGIMSLVANLFRGAGIILVALSVVAMIFTSLKKFFSFLLTGNGGPRPDLFKTTFRLGAIIAVIAALLVFVPVSPSPKVVVVVHYKDAAVCRVETPGFVRAVGVKNGQPVRKGELLARLENPDRTKQLGQVRLAVKASELRQRAFYEQGLIAAYQSEQETLNSLMEQQESLVELVQGLDIRAPITGRVWGRRLGFLEGRFLNAGEKLVTVVPLSEPEMLISARQQNSDDLQQRNDDNLQIKFHGRSGMMTGKMERVEMTATTALPHPALASSSNGPLLVKARGANRLSARQQGLALEDRGEASYFAGINPDRIRSSNQELVQPRIPAVATIADGGHELLEGEWGYAKLSNTREYRLGEWLYRGIERFVRRKWEQSQAG